MLPKTSVVLPEIWLLVPNSPYYNFMFKLFWFYFKLHIMPKVARNKMARRKKYIGFKQK